MIIADKRYVRIERSIIMKIRHSSKSFRLKLPKSTPPSLSDNLLFSPSELKQMHRSEKWSMILKIAIPCLLVAVIGTTVYAIQSKAYNLPNNSLADTSGINSLSNIPTSTNTSSTSGLSSLPTSTNTSEPTNPASTNSQTTNNSNLQAQLNAIQAKAMDSVNAAEASANAAQAQDTIENNTLNAEAQVANQAAAADNQAAAQDLANVANANNTTLTPAEQYAVKANAARLSCIAQATGQYGQAMEQLNSMGGTAGLNSVGVASKEASLQNKLTSATNSCKNQ